VHPWSIEGLALQKEVRREGQASRKAEVAALLPSFMDLRAQAHFRFNRLQRLREAYRTAVTSAEQGRDRLPLPLAFTYEEEGDPGQGVPHRERLHFRPWDRRSFVLAHGEQYSKYVLIDVQLRRRAFEDACNGWYLEFVRSEALHRDGLTEGFWFLDLLRLGLLGRAAMDGSPDEVAAKQVWLRSWGYGEKDGALVAPFHGHHAGLLTLSSPVARATASS